MSQQSREEYLLPFFFTGPPSADTQKKTVAANKSSLRWRRPPPHTATEYTDYVNK